MKKTVTALLGGAFCLSGCAVTSFAPPIVNLQDELTFEGTQSSFNAVCSPKPNTSNDIKQDVEGARRLISNFILTYRCQAHRAAEGRQMFEVPGFVVAAGAATAAAFGAPADVAIGAGAAGAALGQGKSYYAPQAKARVFDDGLEALLCINNEAVGIDAFTLKAISDVEETNGDTAQTALQVAQSPDEDSGGEVSVSSRHQYFDMIRAALFSVERVVAQRLSASGTPFDTESVLTEIEALREKAETSSTEEDAADADAAALVTAPATVPGATATGATIPTSVINQLSTKQRGQLSAALAAKSNIQNVSTGQVATTLLKLKKLQPKLQQCVVRAKI